MTENHWIPWLDRTFENGIAPERAAEFIGRLQDTPSQLAPLLGTTSKPITQRPSPKSWSVLEHIGHLYALEELWMTRFHEFAAGAETLTAAEMTNRKTWEMAFNEKLPEAVLKLFRDAREEMIAFLANRPPEYFGRTALHPRLRQPMNPVDLMNFLAEHDDHHLLSIQRILAEEP